MSVCIVVPCFDEAARLDAEAFRELSTQVDRVLFVDDGSTDGTGRILAGIAESTAGRVDVLTLQINAGKAEAVRLGLRRAIELGSDIVGYLDADLAAPTSEIVRLVEIAQREPERVAVIGSRVALLGHRVHRRPTRHYLGRLYATGASLALGVPVYDTQCGAKVFRVGGPLRDALAEPFHDRWSFDVELLGRLLAAPDGTGDDIIEVPLVSWSDMDGSSVGALGSARALLSLVGVRRRVQRHHRGSA
ncbi:MAG: glycosyltransferase [Ilumatobacteraceae bacterium]